MITQNWSRRIAYGATIVSRSSALWYLVRRQLSGRVDVRAIWVLLLDELGRCVNVGERPN